MFLTPEERARIRAPLKGDFETFRLTNRALVAALKGQAEEGDKLLQQAETHAPGSPVVKMTAARLLLLRERYLEALDALEEARRRAAADAATKRTLDLLLLDAANRGFAHYGPGQKTERWRCAKVAAENDPTNPLALVRWMELVYTTEPTPENFRRMATAGDRLLVAQPKLTSTGVLGSLLENVVVAHLNVGEEKQALAWLNKAKGQLKLEDWLWLRYRAYRKATRQEEGAIEAGNNLLAFAPLADLPALLGELVELVKEARGPREARTYLEEHGAQVWKRALADGKSADKARLAQALARAWGDLGDAARQKKWNDKAAGGK